MSLNYLLDEHVDPALASGLRQRDPSILVWCIGDPGAPQRNTSDPVILDWCELHNFILVTNNRRTIPIHLSAHVGAGRHVPGIFMLNPNLGMRATI
jgi:hypothetical protein